MGFATNATYSPYEDNFENGMEVPDSLNISTEIVLNKKEKWLDIGFDAASYSGGLCMGASADLTDEQLCSISRATLEQIAAKLQAKCLAEIPGKRCVWREAQASRFMSNDTVRHICEEVLGFAPRWVEASGEDA